MKEKNIIQNCIVTPDGTILNVSEDNIHPMHIDENGFMYEVRGRFEYSQVRTNDNTNSYKDEVVYFGDEHINIRNKLRHLIKNNKYCKLVLLSEMTIDDIKSILKNPQNIIYPFTKKMLFKELNYRKNNNLKN